MAAFAGHRFARMPKLYGASIKCKAMGFSLNAKT